MFGPDWIVTPGIRTVIAANDSGLTKKLERLDMRYQKANPIIMKPAITLVLENSLVNF
jgi:hypothetical protein